MQPAGKYSNEILQMLKAPPKQNCWEFKSCGREPGGAHVSDLGVCPASSETKLDGIHEGKNAGRSCWVVAGTMCNDEIQGIFAQKYGSCFNCDFYISVRKEEGTNYKLIVLLMKRLNDMAILSAQQLRK